MAIAFANLGASANPDLNDNVDATAFTNTSWTPPTGDLIVAFAAATSVVTGGSETLTGNGITWTRINSFLFQTDRRIVLFGADAAGSSAGATTMTWGEQATACMLSFFHVTGVDLSGGVAAAFVQTVTATDASNTTLSLTLAAEADAANRPIAGFFHGSNEVTTPRTNWTEADDLAGAIPIHCLETQWRPDAFETTASATWATAGVAGGVAAELKAAVAGGAKPKSLLTVGVG